MPVVDGLIRGADYLAADRYPTITFRLDRLAQTSKNTADIEGRITLRGVTRPLSLKAQVFAYGPAKDDPDRFEAGFNLTGEIDRTAVRLDRRPARRRRGDAAAHPPPDDLALADAGPRQRHRLGLGQPAPALDDGGR